MLTYALQDEFKARAEYEAIIEKFDIGRPFSNIMKSEEQHISFLLPLFKTHGVAVPPDNSADYLIIPETVKAAFETGVQAEIDNIAMYELFLEKKLPADVRDIFLLLKSASENHLRAFKNNLRKY